MHTIKNTLLALLTALTLTTVNAENLTARLGTGYTMGHVVNGVQRSEDSVFAGLDLGVTYDKIDFSLSSVALTGPSVSDWQAGAAKNFVVMEGLTMRVGLDAYRHQLATSSTEGALSVAFQNKYITPYIKGSYDFDLSEQGFIVGLTKDFTICTVQIAPSVEFGNFESYQTFNTKICLSKNLFKHVQLFSSVGYYKNDGVPNYALEKLDGKFLSVGGVRWVF